jgi:antagonist of KipI
LGSVETLEILTPGPLTTVQDRGRFGFGQYGVPPSGALDPFSLRVGNLLVGNRENEASLEITVIGPKIVALINTLIAITGADLQPKVNDTPIEMWLSQLIRKGDILSFKGPRSGCRAYLAIGGGIKVESIMGSKSTNLAAQFGGLEGRPLRRGDIISSDSPARHLKSVGRSLDQRMIPSYTKDQDIRVISGPQDDHFSTKAKEIFTGSPFRVTPKSDRAGIRLAGPRIEAKKNLKESIISEGVVPGTIQIPGDAQPIIILGETVTGGYRKIATVISADLPLLGQLKPGDTVHFRKVSMDEAYQAIREMEGMVVGSF